MGAIYPSLTDIVLFALSYRTIRLRIIWFLIGLGIGGFLFSQTRDDDSLTQIAALETSVAQQALIPEATEVEPLPTLSTIPAPTPVEKPSPQTSPASSSSASPISESRKVQMTIRKGDTLVSLLKRAGGKDDDIQQLALALRKVYDPRKLKAGQKLAILREPIETGHMYNIRALSFRTSNTQRVIVYRDPNGKYVASEKDIPLSREIAHASGMITNSLVESTAAAGIPNNLVMELVKAYSYDVDFQREIREGDRFDILYEQYQDPNGKTVEQGKVIYASLALQDKTLTVYRFTRKNGESEYYDDKGHSVKKGLLRTPIPGARISSGYGKRKHPILGYNKMHKGVDFAAGTGTPVYAAGDGVISYVGRKGGYGNYIRIQHNNTYSTAYAHLNRFAKQSRKWAKVKQGDIIGYVGTTGRSTGPHLHYELLAHGRQIDPAKATMPVSHRLAGNELKRFREWKEELHQIATNTTPSVNLASAEH